MGDFSSPSACAASGRGQAPNTPKGILLPTSAFQLPMPLAFFTITTPLMLLGASLVVLPLAAHLLNRKAQHRIVFPSVALLASVAANQSSFFKLRKLLLLLLRSLTVLLIALAFAQPLWWGHSNHRSPPSDSNGNALAMVLVLDQSASTQQHLGSSTAAAELKALALGELAALRPGIDRANVVLADANPKALFEQTTPNLGALRSALQNTNPTHQHTDLNAALALAIAQLEQSPSGSKQIVILSDGQQSSWTNVNALNLPSNVSLSLQTLTQHQRQANTALSQPRARPAAPHLGMATELSVQLNHFGKTPSRQRVELWINQTLIDTRWAQLEPRQPQHIHFTHRFQEHGDHHVRFVLQDTDALSTDNTAHHIVHCAKRLPVIVIGDIPHDNPQQPGTAGYHVTRALAPYSNQDDPYRVTHLSSHAVTQAALQNTALVVVGDILHPSATLANDLAAYIDQGGSALILAGSHPLKSPLLLPWTLNARLPSVQLAAPQPTAELAGLDTAALEALGRLPLGRAWQTQNVRSDARILAHYNNGAPALATRAIGQGHLVAASFSPAQDTSELGKYGLFVALMQSLAQHLTLNAAQPLPTHPGHPLSITCSAPLNPQGPAPSVQGPNTQPIQNVIYSLRGEQTLATLAGSQLQHVGVYNLKQDKTLLGRTAVNLAPRESDLQPLAVEVLTSQLSQRGATVTAAIANTTAASLTQPTDLWGWLLLGAMLTLAIEMGMLTFWKH